MTTGNGFFLGVVSFLEFYGSTPVGPAVSDTLDFGGFAFVDYDVAETEKMGSLGTGGATDGNVVKGDCTFGDCQNTAFENELKII